MKIVLKNFLLIITFIISIILFNNSSFASQFKNVNDILVSKFGWSKNEIGPFGQFYRIDVDNGKSYLDLHQIVKDKYGGSKKTYICDLFKSNTTMIIRNNYLIETNYSPEKALEARRKYILTGKLSDAEWSLVDIMSWLVYIKEGTGSDNIKQEIFNKKLNIISCSSHHTVVSYNSKKIKFPNLILTMPPLIFLDPNLIVGSIDKQNSNKSNKKSKNPIIALLDHNMKQAKLISQGINSLIEDGKLSKDKANALEYKIFDTVKPINATFLGGICNDKNICQKFLLALNKMENIDLVLDATRKKFMSDYKKNN